MNLLKHIRLTNIYFRVICFIFKLNLYNDIYIIQSFKFYSISNSYFDLITHEMIQITSSSSFSSHLKKKLILLQFIILKYKNNLNSIQINVLNCLFTDNITVMVLFLERYN